MAAPIVMFVEQIQGGPVQKVFAPFTTYGYYDPSTQAASAATPEFCEGAWLHPYGDTQAPPRQRWRQPDAHPGYCVPQRAPVRHGQFSGKTARELPPLLQRPVHVRLSNLPRILCSDRCLQAAIEQARLDKDVRSVEIDDATACEAIVTLTSEAAAQRCIRHFNGLRWAKSSTPVSARYTSLAKKEAAQEEKDDQSPHGAKERDSEAIELLRKPEDEKKSQAEAKTEAGSVATASTSGIPFPADTIHIRRLAMKMLPSKKRWADYEDDEDFEEESMPSTRMTRMTIMTSMTSTLAGTCDDASSVAESMPCSPTGTCDDATSVA